MAEVVPTSWQLDETGGLVGYADHFKHVTQEDAANAVEWENKILTAKVEIEAGFLKLCYMLDIFDRERFYLARGYETMKAWAESPEIELSWRVVQDLIRIKREAIPALEATVGDDGTVERMILQAGISKVRAALPLLSDETTKDDFAEVIDLAPQMPWNDVRQEVKERRGLALAVGEQRPVLFKGAITVYDDHATITIYAIDGTTSESIGKLRVKKLWLPRFEERFGKLVEFTYA